MQNCRVRWENKMEKENGPNVEREYKGKLLEDVVKRKVKLKIRDQLGLVDYAIDLASQKEGSLGKIYLYKMFNDHYSWLPGSINRPGGGLYPWMARTDGSIFGFAMGNWSQNFPGYLQAGLKIARALSLEEELKISIGQMDSGSKFLKSYEASQEEK